MKSSNHNPQTASLRQSGMPKASKRRCCRRYSTTVRRSSSKGAIATSLLRLANSAGAIASAADRCFPARLQEAWHPPAKRSAAALPRQVQDKGTPAREQTPPGQAGKRGGDRGGSTVIATHPDEGNPVQRPEEAAHRQGRNNNTWSDSQQVCDDGPFTSKRTSPHE
jgi:hypothetical protein